MARHRNTQSPGEAADAQAARRPRDGLFVRVYFGDGRHLGPGMIELLETIRRERSILSAARSLGMSYRRAWLLVDEIGRTFRQPVVETHPGRRGHGTDLTPFGERLIALYREVERRSNEASRAAIDEMRAGLAPQEAPAGEPVEG
ncbi:LysR family transcriptional regulator [Ancylobacter dichloromethanicus]|uniref:LysR family transcriptional regulator n=1 Tax=Ancylobacter dichloromethanicus TaxID=518825 RepID=A0A9W6N031_9HYPH|nr:LysR family transcriptional regulator [Ancylobacter dichloromethanicus]MBS7553580.1 LysR family transcriptional regulator [Ancylobacter dichloromethanicus]GLK72640.1 LysR family transcriptional regulator [Ancylobacter dichloromethanicus]